MGNGSGYRSDKRFASGRFQGGPQAHRVAASKATGAATEASRRAHAESDRRMDYKKPVRTAKEPTDMGDTNKKLATLPSSPLPSPENPPPREAKRRPIPRKVRQAIELIVTGVCRTKQSAADRVGMQRESLSRWLNRPAGAEALRTRAAAEVASSAGRAAARLNQLIDSSSQKVALDATKYSLGVAGIKPASDPVSVNVGVKVAGYVIDLRERNDHGPLPKVTIDGAGAVVVDTKPEAIAGIGPGAKPAE